MDTLEIRRALIPAQIVRCIHDGHGYQVVADLSICVVSAIAVHLTER
jgi:hypothetical protein